MKRAVLTLVLLSALSSLTACGSSSDGGGDGQAGPAAPSAPNLPGAATGTAVLGKRWPLKVDGGRVKCDSSKGVVYLSQDGTAYSVNGTAVGEHRYKEIRPIWADDPDIKGLKIDMSPLIEQGLKLC